MTKVDLKTTKDGDYLTLDQVSTQGEAPGLRRAPLREGNNGADLLVFGRGDEIMAGLEKYANDTQVAFASFSGIGAGKQLKLAWYCLNRKAYRVIDAPGQIEIISMLGNIGQSEKGEPVVHCHMTIGDEHGRTISGHLLQGFVEPTLELVVERSPSRYVKTFRPEIGLTLYDLPTRGL
jgi:hypothetical protein